MNASWIRVTSSVPKPGERVLVSYNGIVAIGRYVAMKQHDGKLGFWEDDSMGSDPINTPTHWAHLPHPPAT